MHFVTILYSLPGSANQMEMILFLAITKHLANIYKSGELEQEGTCSILEHMGNDGKRLKHFPIPNCGGGMIGKLSTGNIGSGNNSTLGTLNKMNTLLSF